MTRRTPSGAACRWSRWTDKEYVVEGGDGKATLPGRGTTFAAVSRASYTTILPFKARTGSSTGSVRIRYHDEYED
ncbi:hypothetical protein ACWC09_39215 [Streptomyces sp. NPDC001617]